MPAACRLCWQKEFAVRCTLGARIWNIVRLKPDGTRWRTGGEVKGKLANWVGSQYSHTTSEHGVSSITTADAHTSAASSWLNWRSCRFKRTRLFRRKTKSGFCACAIKFQTRYTYLEFMRFSAVPPAKCRHNNLQEALTTSFQVSSNASIT